MKLILSIAFFFFSLTFLYAQKDKDKENLGDKEYIIIKDYRPVLGESYKISDSPEGDTSSSVPPEMDYSLRPEKFTSEYDLPVIKAVKIKDEQLAKLYRTFLRLGIGNYTTYSGDLYVNALRSKKGSIGLALNHHSGDPSLKLAGPAGFSDNHAGVTGKYFFDHSTFSGDIDYNRNVVHYYGYDTDTIIRESDLKQRFNRFGTKISYGSNYLTPGHIDYNTTFGFSTLNDLSEVSESDFIFAARAGKKVDSYYVSCDASLNYFKKSPSKNETNTLLNDLNRSIVSFIPAINFNQDKINLVLGVNLSVEKNLDSDIHFFPKVDISLPIAENILYAFAGVNGNVIKNSYQTIVAENPFVTPGILPFNTVNKLELKAGLNGNFSSRISFVTMVKYSKLDKMLLYYNDAVYFNEFNAIYTNGKVLDLHAEVSYQASNRLTSTLRFDQYSYSMELEAKAWHRPNTEMAFDINYNLWDKFIVTAGFYASGKYYARIQDGSGYIAKSVKGYLDANLGVEYKYSKLLSLYVNLNNFTFAKYQIWNNFYSERLNVLGGIKYSF